MKKYKQFNTKIIIRREFFGIILFSIFFDLHAQSEQFQNLPQYLFPDFSTSTVKMKVGKTLTLFLNYNIVTEKMVFFQKDQVFDMVNPETVDTAIIDNRKFIPVGKAFYEVIMERPLSLFIEHKGDIVDQGKPTGYGGTSEVSSSTYYSKMDYGASAFNVKLTGDLIIKPYKVFWISINGDKYSFVNERQFDKIFPGKEKEIRLYIKENHLKFANPQDVKELVQFCISSTK
jgi:hypothetical protein